MSKELFNHAAGAKLNEYVLTLSPHAGVIPLRGSKGRDQDPQYQAELFRRQLGDWLEAEGAYQKRHALTTEALPASADGKPQLRIVCTEECLQKVTAHFPTQIKGSVQTKTDVSSKRTMPRPGVRPPKTPKHDGPC